MTRTTNRRYPSIVWSIGRKLSSWYDAKKKIGDRLRVFVCGATQLECHLGRR
jgi:hypothetical protein